MCWHWWTWATTASPPARGRARQSAAAVPDIEYTPRVCLRLAQYETRYTSRKKALALAAEAKQGFALLAREQEPDAAQWLAEAKRGFAIRKREGDGDVSSWLEEAEALIRQLLEEQNR